MSRLYTLLNNYYGSDNVWAEVESVFREEGVQINIDDIYEPFKNLVIGILSQNTSDRNSTRAYIGLSRSFRITPDELAKAPINKIRDSIKPGGLYNIKAKRIKELAQTVLKRFNGDLSAITKLPKDRAREALLSLRGIGAKTTDVFLAYCMNQDTLPIDTNIKRVAKRMGIAGSEASYEEVQKALARVIPHKRRVRVHELLIRLGRDFCKVQKPLCGKCPVNSVCEKQL
ncbi:endonuclease III [Candidatus Woesearchaeota archaeon CG08_land_8_20_14_0_20_47_9]|nr:MAG: hypothetical protein AUJ69_01520 [Candidatus Woesearchaeota archaeon CG1_02_47_18]PIN76629.1 MAG: hypothetical protein COV22_00145 [Candidatus Woesearchaeota archaeon CG10_big_fil_rev_8_21_14_0_10_47_5]PIO04460.1 MAG: endonuclease III [Candidatus Woesearchaeota archaeon CG08_land_8_20_14_0_20_47_9]HII30328.1 endonuclease III [Candidatus Woesearchaeota archaeon]